MAISENIINDIRDRADIVEVIDSFIHLKKTGGNFKALCPFHHEKTPSFVVSPQKQIFHCFGCGEGGNIFHFLMKHQSMSFIEAVNYAASLVGIDIPDQKRGVDLSAFLDLNKKAARFYSRSLFSSLGKNCRDYIKSRGLGEDTVKLFNLGYAPQSWDSLSKQLKDEGYNNEFLIKAGLTVRAKDGKGFYDIFRDRLIFPIIDHNKKVVGFGGRVFSKAMPKYLNSPHTPLYQKGRTLYGADVTLPDIKREKTAIIVEGYLDMIMLYQAGIKNVAASLGTALTQDQVRFLKRYSDEVIIVYDGDESGQIASLRGLDIVFESGIKANAVMLPKGYDPDSFIQEKGGEEFLKLLAKKRGIFDYKLDVLKSIYGVESLDSRIKIVNEMFASLEKVGNRLIRAEYIKELSTKMGFEEKILWDEFSTKSGRIKKDAFKEEVLRQKSYSSVEASLVYIMLNNSEVIPEIKGVLEPEEFITDEIQSLVKVIYNIYPDSDKLKLANLLNVVAEEEARILAEIMAENVELSEDVFEEHLNQCIINLKIQKIKNYCNFLEQEIKKAQQDSDNKRLDILFRELNDIKKKELET
ncbi:MAG: DNA primase [Candidatus Kaelpia imicola]|nr:DNA primase [Candidatus Kaelpia imicola]